MLFHAKIGIWGGNLYESHTLFILCLEGNHTLFGEKLYFIWKFSSGNTEYIFASLSLKIIFSVSLMIDIYLLFWISLGHYSRELNFC